MKIMGLIGGMSWESTATYYRLINEGIRARLGGHHSAALYLYSVDFAAFEQMQREGRFYVGRLLNRFGLEVTVPREKDRGVVHRVIYEELVKGLVREDSRARYLRIVDRLTQDGAQGIILGCTEIAMLIDPQALPVPCFDTTALHASAAIELSLASSA